MTFQMSDLNLIMQNLYFSYNENLKIKKITKYFLKLIYAKKRISRNTINNILKKMVVKWSIHLNMNLYL